MRIVNITCPGCGESLLVDAHGDTAECEFCGLVFPIDHGTQAAKPDGSEKAGHDLETGGPRAREEARSTGNQPDTNTQASPPPKKKRRTWLWVLGWILVFPVPLTILMLKSPRTRNLNPKLRVAIVVIGWIVYLAIGLAGGASRSNTASRKASDAEKESTTQAVGSENSTAQENSSAREDAGAAVECIELWAGVPGDYGREIVLDEGLSDETHEIAYYVPGGNYTVKSLGAYPSVVNVFKGLRKRADGASEWTGYGDSVTLGQGETAKIEVPDGWLITTPSMTSHLVLIPEGSGRKPEEFDVDEEVNVLVEYDADIKEICHKMLSESYKDVDANWDAGSWEWAIARADVDNLDVVVTIPSSKAGGEDHQAWMLITPIIKNGKMTDATCHFMGMDVINRLFGYDAPEYVILDEAGQKYFDERADTVKSLGGL